MTSIKLAYKEEIKRLAIPGFGSGDASFTGLTMDALLSMAQRLFPALVRDRVSFKVRVVPCVPRAK